MKTNIHILCVVFAMIFFAFAASGQTSSDPTAGQGGAMPPGEGGSMPAAGGGSMQPGMGGSMPPGGTYQPGQYPPPQGQPGPYNQQGPYQPGPYQGQMPMDGQQMNGPQQGGDGMGRWVKDMQRVVPSLEKRMTALEKKGYKISQTAKDAMAKMKEMIEKAKAGTTESDIDMGETSQLMEDINEGIQNAEMASRFSSQMKNIERQIKMLGTTFTRAQKRAKTLKTDISGFMSDWQTLISEINTLKDQAKQKISDGDVEGASDLMMGDVNDKMEEAGDKQRVFELITNTNQILRQISTDLKALEKYVAQAKRRGEDTTKLQELLAIGRRDEQKLRDILGQRPIDSDLLIETLEELYDTKTEFMDEFQGGSNMFNMPGTQMQQQAPMQQQQQQMQMQGFQQPMMQGGQTCNVNGVEMPGACNTYNQGMGYGQQPPAQPMNFGPLNFIGSMQASMTDIFNSFIASLPIF